MNNMFSLLSTSRWSRRWTVSDTLAGDRPELSIDLAARRVLDAELKSQRRLAVYGATLVAAGLGACATMPPQPTSQMTRAESAIEQARRAGAGELANEPLREADTQLARAKTAAAAGRTAYAAALVEEAYADARLADLTAQSVTAAKAAAEVDQSIFTLQRETNRTN
jgi:hypothetical protein